MVAFDKSAKVATALAAVAITTSHEGGRPDGAKPEGSPTVQRDQLADASFSCSAPDIRTRLQEALAKMAQRQSDQGSAITNQSGLSANIAAVTQIGVESLRKGARAGNAPDSGSNPTFHLGGVGVQDFGPAAGSSWISPYASVETDHTTWRRRCAGRWPSGRTLIGAAAH